MFNRRTQPWKLEPVNPRKRVRVLEPDGEKTVAQAGFERMAQADRHTGIRPSTGGDRVYPRGEFPHIRDT